MSLNAHLLVATALLALVVFAKADTRALRDDNNLEGRRRGERPSGECVDRSVSDVFPLSGEHGDVGVKGLRDTNAPYAVKAELAEANDFTVHYFRTFKVAYNRRFGEVYVLTQCGFDAPNATEVSEALVTSGLSADSPHKTFTIPLQSVAVTATTPLAMMEDLDLYPRISYVTQWASSSCAALLHDCNGDFNDTDTDHANSVDAIIRADIPGPVNYNPAHEPKIIQFSATQDPGALARAEWHIFIGLFFNKELHAVKLFEDIANKFASLAARADAANDAGELKKVVWCNHNDAYNDPDFPQWNSPETIVCSTGGIYQYKKDIVEAAGGELLDHPDAVDGKLTFAVDDAGLASMHEYIAQADVLVDESYAWDPSTYTRSNFLKNYYIGEAETPAYKMLGVGGAVLRLDKAILLERDAEGNLVSTAWDWLQTGVSRPDIAAEDLFGYLYPSAADADRDSYFMRSLNAGESVHEILVENCQAQSCDSLEKLRKEPICSMDIEMCSDGKNYVKAAFRDPKKGCQHEEVCDFPGLKDKQPLECLTGKDANNPFPLIFDGGDFKFDANALDGSEPDRTVVKLDEAEDFSVMYLGTYKVVTNNKFMEIYVLYQCGVFPPLKEDVVDVLVTELGIDIAKYASPKYFSIPLQRVGVTATTPVAMMEDLGLHSRIKHLPSYAVSSCSQHNIECHGAFDSTNPKHIEELDAVIKADTAGGYITPVLEEAEGMVIQFSASADPGTLKRAEWHKFIGLFFNKELEAQAMYDEIASTYNKLKEQASAASGTNKKKVAWCSEYTGSISCHTGGYYQYKLELVQDAGGMLLNDTASCASANSINVGKDGNCSYSTLHEFFKGVDIVIDESYEPIAIDDYTMDLFMQNFRLTEEDKNVMPFLVKKQVWRTDKAWGNSTGGLDWFESAIGRPDVVLKDMLTFITPAAAPAGHVTHFFRNIAAGEASKPIYASECKGGCSGLSGGLKDTVICPLDVLVCDKLTFKSRSPKNNCEFDPCPYPLKKLADIGDDAKVTVLSLMFTIPNMNTDDFRNAIQNLFKENLATAAGLPIENVRIKEVKAGSVVVDVDVVFPGEDAGRANALVQKMSDSTNSVFKSDVFGAVTAEFESITVVTKAEWEADAKSSKGSRSYPMDMTIAFVVAAAVSAVALVC